MSDGNYNRALLPHAPFSSGLKAGRSQMRQMAVEAFAEVVSKHGLDPGLADDFVRSLDAKCRL